MTEFATDVQMTLKQSTDAQREEQHPTIIANREVINEIDTVSFIIGKVNVVNLVDDRVTVTEETLQALIDNYAVDYSDYRSKLNSFKTSDMGLIEYKFTMFGDINNFYPLPFKFNSDIVKRFSIYRGIHDDSSTFTANGKQPSGGLIQLTGSNAIFRINAYSNVGDICMQLLNQRLYSSYNGDPETFSCSETNGVYLRGGISYTIVADSFSMISDITAHISMGLQPNWAWGLHVAESIPDTNIESIEQSNVYENDNHLEGR